MDADSLNQMLLAGSAIVLLAVLAVRGSVRVGLPSLLIYLGMGIILGEALLGIRFDDASTAQALGFAALVVILTEGGLTTRWSEVRPSLGVGLALATVGVGVSVCLVAVFAHFALDLSWQLSFLLGAITSPTDAAAVFTVLRRVPLKPSLLGALEAESGLNDAPTVLLVVLISTEHSVQGGALGFAALVVYELVGGAVLGAAVGWLGAMLLRRVALPASGLYPISVLAIAVLSYSGSAALHASGFAAVYVTALILGNSELPHRSSTRSFAEGLAWLAQIGLFIMLGLLASPGTFGRAGRRRGRARRCADRWSHARSACWCRLPFGCRGGSRASSRSPGCVARCRSCSRRSRWPNRSVARPRSSTSCSCWSSCSP